MDNVDVEGVAVLLPLEIVADDLVDDGVRDGGEEGSDGGGVGGEVGIKGGGERSGERGRGERGVQVEGVGDGEVETVDYRKSAGQEEEPHPEKVVVTHLIHDDNSGKQLAEKLQSAKDAVAETTVKKTQ